MAIFGFPAQPLKHEEDYYAGSTPQQIKNRSAIRYKRNGFPLELIILDEIDNTVLIIKYEYTKLDMGLACEEPKPDSAFPLILALGPFTILPYLIIPNHRNRVMKIQLFFKKTIEARQS